MLKTQLYVLYVNNEYPSEKEELRKLEELEILCEKLDAELKWKHQNIRKLSIIKFATGKQYNSDNNWTIC